MNKLSKLTALLLAIVLALGVPMQVMAESEDTAVQDAIDPLTDYLKVADTALYKTIMGFTKYTDYWRIGYLLEDEDVIAYIANNDANRVKEIQDHLDKLWWEGCIGYTAVAPFVEPLSVQTRSASAFSLQARAAGDDSGLYLSKTATPNADGSNVTIKLESFVTGTVKTETVVVAKPADIVLVLDYSSSMGENFGSGSNRTTRLRALVTAVNSFIDAVAAQNGDLTAPNQHRISVVKFDRYGEQINDWTFVSGEDNIADLKVSTTELSGGSGTNQGDGMTLANGLLKGTAYTNDQITSGEGRDRVVVLFTDGLPGKGSSNSGNPVDFARVAINQAKEIKDSGATVYSVAILPGANPVTTVNPWTGLHTYDDVNYANALLHAISSNYLGATATLTDGNSRLAITPGDLNPAVTDKAHGYYLTAEDPSDLNDIFQDISTNIQSGSTSSTLTQTTVVKDVMSPYFELPYTVNADGTRDYSNVTVTVSTQKYTGQKVNGERQWVTETLGFTPTIEKGHDSVTGKDYVTVTNFNFMANYVADVDHVDPYKSGDTDKDSYKFYGRKLIIEFNIKPINGFIGGNDVLTNDASSGIYKPSADSTPENPKFDMVGKFDEPDVNVAFKEIHIQKEEQYIYLGNHANLDTLLTSFGITYTFESGDGTPYTVNGYNNGYVMLRYMLKDNDSDAYMYYTIMPGRDAGTWTYVDGNGNVSDTAGMDIRPWIENDHTYSISYEVFAKEKVNEDGTVKYQLDANGNETTTRYTPETTGTLEATVYVFKPEVTFQDSKYKYMDQLAATAAADHYNTVNWVGDTQVLYKNPKFTWDLDHRPVGVMPSGERPTLTFEYDTDLESWINSANEVYTTTCVPVNVTKVTATSSHGVRDITSGTTSVRIECDCDVCNTTQYTQTSGLVANHNPEFVIHVYDVHGKLAISKTVEGTGASADDTFLFTITGPGITGKMQVILKGGQSVTINNLLVGDYVVKEETGWSWRYTCTESDATLEAKVEGNKTAAVIFTNTLTNQTWLDGNAHADNNFAGSTTTEGGGK